MENTSAEDQETIHEFLVESHENLSRLDQDLVELEKHPQDADLLGSIFRTIHTIKGACGFLAFSVLEAITHQAETLLSQLRDGQRELNPALVSLILEAVDATRKVLAAIETSGKEGAERFEDLTERLRLAAQLTAGEETQSASEPNGAGTPPVSVAESVVEKTSSDIHEIGQAEEQAERRDRRRGDRREEDVTRSSAAVDANIRVGVGLLDKLMDLVGELVLTRNQILQFNLEREDAALNATSQRLGQGTTSHQEPCKATQPSKRQTFPSSSPLDSNEARRVGMLNGAGLGAGFSCTACNRCALPARKLERLRLYIQCARVGAGRELGLACQIDFQVQVVSPVCGSVGW